MTDPALPPELADLERRLLVRPRVEPPASLGPRVLAAVRDRIREPASLTAMTGWRFWAAVAATVLVVVNLSMSLATNTDWYFEPSGTTNASEFASQLRALAPDLPEAELRRQSLLVRAGAGLTPIADLNSNREPLRWDER